MADYYAKYITSFNDIESKYYEELVTRVRVRTLLDRIKHLTIHKAQKNSIKSTPLEHWEEIQTAPTRTID